jgi:hypothetical protein
MNSSQNTLCISESASARPKAESASPNVLAETLHRYISDVQATNLPQDPLERLMAILDEALEIVNDEEDTMRPTC